MSGFRIIRQEGAHAVHPPFNFPVACYLTCEIIFAGPDEEGSPG
jgi:hypothetical protein